MRCDELARAGSLGDCDRNELVIVQMSSQHHTPRREERKSLASREIVSAGQKSLMHPVVAAANPLRGVASDAAALRSVVEHVAGPVVLVAHSYGGSVISTAPADEHRVKALVSIAAFTQAVSVSHPDVVSRVIEEAASAAPAG